MKSLKSGDFFRDSSYVEMINGIIGTNYYKYLKCWKNLYANRGIIAWFVFMDGTSHGYEEGWVWQNTLSEDKTLITEYNVSNDKTKLTKVQISEGFRPYRLAFRLDPYANEARNICQFLGGYMLTGFENEELNIMRYSKVLDEVKIASKGEYGDCLTSKDDFLNKDLRYMYPIEKLNFSKEVLLKLKRVHINFVYQLLEIGYECESANSISLEVRNNLFNLFGIKDLSQNVKKQEVPKYEYCVKVGNKVNHKLFGCGVVEKVVEHENNEKNVSINFCGNVKIFKFPMVLETGLLKII